MRRSVLVHDAGITLRRERCVPLLSAKLLAVAVRSRDLDAAGAVARRNSWRTALLIRSVVEREPHLERTVAELEGSLITPAAAPSAIVCGAIRATIYSTPAAFGCSPSTLRSSGSPPSTPPVIMSRPASPDARAAEELVALRCHPAVRRRWHPAILGRCASKSARSSAFRSLGGRTSVRVEAERAGQQDLVDAPSWSASTMPAQVPFDGRRDRSAIASLVPNSTITTSGLLATTSSTRARPCADVLPPTPWLITFASSPRLQHRLELGRETMIRPGLRYRPRSRCHRTPTP